MFVLGVWFWILLGFSFGLWFVLWVFGFCYFAFILFMFDGIWFCWFCFLVCLVVVVLFVSSRFGDCRLFIFY